MNETVRGMVEKLFENTVMNDETKALMDEVMNNCQERFEGLAGKGLPEEEILAAVSDSLKGMEEIVAGYPKKEALKVSVPGPDPDGLQRFDPASVTRLVARLTDADVEVVPGEDHDIAVELTHGPETSLTAVLDGGVLRIAQRRIPGGGQADTASRPSGSRAPWDIAGGINDAIRQLTQIVQRFGVTVSADNHVRIRMPIGSRIPADVQSLSGDIRWAGAPAEHLLLDTTSGDLDAFTPNESLVGVAQFKSASGDIRADLDAEDLTMQSMSGDINWSGRAERLTATAVSGDLTMTGAFRECRLKSISGDVEVTSSGTAAEIRATSTSGDVNVSLPASVTSAKASLRTISGDTHVNNLLLSDSAPLFIQADSVSGDITITRHKV